jgi:hypothetical protein
MDPARQLAQLGGRRLELCRRLLEQLARAGRILFDAVAREPQAQRQCDEALLRAVMQVSLEGAALGEPDLD